MKRRALPTLLGLTIFTAIASWGQQSPTPPKAPTGPSNLATNRKTLEDMLRSRGPVRWTQNLNHGKSIGDRVEFLVEKVSLSEETVNVYADPKSCMLRVSQQSNLHQVLQSSHHAEPPVSISYYLDEIFDVQVLPAEDFMHQYRHQGNASYQENLQPALYSVSIAGWGYRDDFKFSTIETAEQFAAILRDAVEQCSSIPAPANSSGGPGLDETLGFIADKLTAQGRVDAKWTEIMSSDQFRTSSPVPANYTSFTVEYFQVKLRAASCILTFEANHARLSFRHIGRIEVLSLKDFRADRNWLSGMAVWHEDQPLTFNW